MAVHRRRYRLSVLLLPPPASTMDGATLADLPEVSATRDDEIFVVVALVVLLVHHRRRCETLHEELPRALP